MEKKNNFMLVMIVVLSISLLGAVSFIVYDKVIKKDEGANTSTKTNNDNQQSTIPTTYEKISYEIKERKDLKDLEDDKYYELYVNNNKVLFDPANSNKYANVKMGLEVRQLADILIISCDEVDGVSVYAVDNNGKIIGEFLNHDSVFALKGIIYSDTVKLDGMDLYITTGNFGNSGDYIPCNGNPDDAVEWTEKFTYLGNNKFSAPTVVKTISAKDYINQKGIDCSKYK